VLLLAIAGVATALSGGVARAAGDDPTGVPPTPKGEIHDDAPEAIVVESPGGPTHEIHHGGPGRHGRWTCHYYLVGGIDGSDAPGPRFDLGPVNPRAGDPVDLHCVNDDGLIVYDEIFVFDPAEPLARLDLPARAADEARRLLAIAAPTVRLSPPATVPQLVGVQTWLWIDDPWVPQQASATLDGVTATVTATPTTVTWALDDGTSVACDGPGTRYDDSRPAAEQSTDCSLVFGRAGRSVLHATVRYATSWTATTGDGEALEPVTRTTDVPVDVVEAQALIR
jgi:hypothetical protein